ncbi:DUF6879 family protein [Acrocarpospora pleiomorpha]|uniref:DUF6879 family protein n=1 Tax=Acrocarpospora pleiomorpha TaxID=90975 RepID=UPI0035A222E0
MLDDSRLVWLHFKDSDDTFTGAELVTDPEILARHRSWRDLARKRALPSQNLHPSSFS